MAERRRQEEIVRLVLELSKTLVSHYQARLAELHLTSPQAMLLHQLDDPLPMNEVAGKLHCDPSNVTGIVDRLEGRGLIERQERIFTFSSAFLRTASALSNTSGWHSATP